MPSDQEIELAHPEAFDFVFGNLPAEAAAEFSDHLEGCPHCQTIVAEYSEIGRIVQSLPPHVEPPADLEDRTVAAVLRALADQPAKAGQPPPAAGLALTRTYQVPDQSPPPPAPPAGEPAPDKAETLGSVTPLPLWRSRRGRLASAWVAAAAVIVLLAVIVVPRLVSTPKPGVLVVSVMHATTAAKAIGDGAATAKATAHQVGGSWTYDFTVSGLKVLPGDQFYECWYGTSGSTSGHPVLASGGTFVVDNSGSASLTMTTGVDPRDFRTMIITAQAPGNGAVQGKALLTGQSAA
jgi:anti-sigma factor RsiW